VLSQSSAIAQGEPMASYERQARALFDALSAGDRAALWRVKWMHPRFSGRGVDEVRTATLGDADARLVVAREHAFDGWDDLVAYTAAVQREDDVTDFERAVEAVVAGDAKTLHAMLERDPTLARRRSTRRHHATLLHYVAANGVEDARQRTPPNAVEIATLLLGAGAEPDALADMYDEQCTTMSMLVSSSPPAEAGVQVPLVEVLLDHGASVHGAGTKWRSPLLTALTFGFLDAARALVRRGAPVDSLAAAAGLDRLDEVIRRFPDADPGERHAALALAAQLGHADVVRFLLDHGEPPDRYNPDGLHSHATPLHQAVWNDHGDVVRLLVERGARLDLPDGLYDGTPLDWATYGKREALAAYLRERAASPRSVDNV
jgi:ankyrin repeat protein